MSYYNRVREVDSAPLASRKYAARDFGIDMKNNPQIVGERVRWLLNGDYGYEEMQAAHRVLGMTARANKVAQLTHMIGVLEWSCPPRLAISEWKKLTASEKAALDKAVKAAMVRDE